MQSLTRTFQPALALQLLHAALCVVWNGVGLAQRAHGVQSIGPTASWTAIVVMIVFGAGLVYFLTAGWKIAYFVLSPIGLLAAMAAIVGALTNDPLNWPSEFWRWAGIAVNAIGLIGFFLAWLTFTRSNRAIT